MTSTDTFAPVRVRRCDDVAGEHIEGELTLLAASKRQIHRLNDSAGAIWEAIDGELQVHEIIEMLVHRFGVDHGQLSDDVAYVLAELSAGGLIELDEITTPPPVTSPPGLLPASAAISVGPFAALESLVRIDVVGTPESDPEVRPLIDYLEDALDPLQRNPSALDVGSLSHVHLAIGRENDRWSLARNGATPTNWPTVTSLLRAVLAEVNAGPIAALRGAIAFHAGAVEFASGVVFFPGQSNAGKSTLVANLLRQGLRYLTDEALAVGIDDGFARPFTKSLCIDAGAQSLFPELKDRHRKASTWDVDPHMIGNAPFASAARPVAVVFPTFCAGADVTFQRLGAADALPRLLEHSFDFSCTGASGAARLLALAAETPCFELVHGGQREHLDVLTQRFGSSGN